METREEQRRELTWAIIVTAVEQGIYYWAKARRYHADIDTNVAHVEIKDMLCENPTWVKIDQEWVEAALTKVRENPGIEIREDILTQILLADRSNGQQGDIDSDGADVLFQIGLYGEIQYS